MPQEHYVDDYCTPDFKIAGAPDCGAAMALSALHDTLKLKGSTFEIFFIVTLVTGRFAQDHP